MKLNFTLLGFCLFICLSSNAIAQEDSKKKKKSFGHYQMIEGSYIVGAQVFNDNFVYNPGYSLTASYGKFVNKQVGIGIGTGYKELDLGESFLPIFGEVVGYKKDKKHSPYIKMQLGYSLAWYDITTQVEGYDFKGGVFIGAGLGRKFKISEDLSINVGWSYQHQFAKMVYNIYNTKEYSEVFNYDMFTVSIGIIRKAK